MGECQGSIGTSPGGCRRPADKRSVGFREPYHCGTPSGYATNAIRWVRFKTQPAGRRATLRIDEAGKNVNVHVLLADDSEGKGEGEGEGEIANALRIIQWRNRAMVITQARRDKNKK